MELKSLPLFQDFNEKHFTQKFVHKNGGNSVFILNFLTGQKMREHKHPGKEVYFFVLQGEGIVITNGIETEASQGDIIQCSGNDTLGFVNSGSEPVSVYVVLSNVVNQHYALNI